MISNRAIELFQLLPSSLWHRWLIAADWIDEMDSEADNFTANAFREGVWILSRNDVDIRDDFGGTSEGCGNGEGCGCGLGDGDGHSHFYATGECDSFGTGDGNGNGGTGVGDGDGSGGTGDGFGYGGGEIWTV